MVPERSLELLEVLDRCGPAATAPTPTLGGHVAVAGEAPVIRLDEGVLSG
jgi:hypothetical protein